MSKLALWKRRIFSSSRIARSVAVLAGGNAGAQFVVVLAAPILTRLYTPTDFGVAGVFAAILGLLLAVASGRYELAIPLPADEETAFDLFILCLGVLVGAVGLCSVAVWLLGCWVLAKTGVEALGSYLWLLPVALLGAGSYQALNYLAIRRRAYPALAKTRISQSIANIGAGLVMGVVHPGPLGLILGNILGQSAGVSNLAQELMNGSRGQLPRTSLTRLCRAGGTFSRFPLFSASASLLNTAGLLLPTIILAACFSPQVAGMFTLAQRLLTVPSSTISLAVSQVFLAEISGSSQDGFEAMPQLFAYFVGKMAILGGVILVGGILGSFVFGWVFGSQWQQAGVYLLFLSPLAAVDLIVSPVSTVTIVKERQDIQLLLDVIRITVVSGSLALPYLFGCSGVVAVGCYSIAMSLVLVLTLIVCRRLAYTSPQVWPATTYPPDISGDAKDGLSNHSHRQSAADMDVSPNR